MIIVVNVKLKRADESTSVYKLQGVDVYQVNVVINY